ncbi:FBP domain-containing protein [Kineococcus vitellinus]|uniref:FBP domain-containing protein n=1 Tax=Kineococcus vitellinus TaxID=2696565 RepID=UPI0030B83CA2
MPTTSTAPAGLSAGSVSDDAIRSCMTNCTRGEAHRMRVPAWVRGSDPVHEVVGWRDPRSAERGWLLVPLGEAVVGLALRAAPGGGARTTAVCDLCGTTRAPGEVSLFVAARAGEPGRRREAVGTHACSDLACADNVRVLRPTPTLRPEPGLSIAERARALHERAVAFAQRVLATA